jgi:hypothetical protein
VRVQQMMRAQGTKPVPFLDAATEAAKERWPEFAAEAEALMRRMWDEAA